ncbi:hypothetical protein SAMN04487887_11825 [Enterococcus casseliflavus]|nr:hypothetical protein SAMN04487887_11825 [Enterococcus casseliflavus]
MIAATKEMGFGACPKFKAKKSELENRRFSGSLSFLFIRKVGPPCYACQRRNPAPPGRTVLGFGSEQGTALPADFLEYKRCQYYG